MRHFTLLMLLFAAAGYTNGYHLVAAPVGTCTNKKAYGIMRMKRGECDTMGGRWNGSPGYSEWTNCHIDWCAIPSSGAVSSQYAWGVDTDQSYTTISISRTYGIIRMIRRDCDMIHGRFNSNPTADEWTDCHLYMKRMDGKHREKMTSLILAGDAQCPNKVAYGIIRMIHTECIQIGGLYNGNPGGNDWIDCHLDICISPVIDCQPSDMWSTIQVCKNPSSSTFTCSFQMTVGVEKGTESSSTSGGHVSTTISSEVGVELKGIFTSKLSVSVTTGFHWENTQSTSSVWSTATTRTLEVKLDPGQSVSINQVVGMCGDFKVDTTEYRVVDVDVPH